jgi:hypothetical protein
VKFFNYSDKTPELKPFIEKAEKNPCRWCGEKTKMMIIEDGYLTIVSWCDNCHDTIIFKSITSSHMNNLSENSLSATCPLCKKVFTNAKEYIGHVVECDVVTW